MATVFVSQTTGFDVRNLWIQNTAGSTNEHFETHTGTESTLNPPSRTDHYDEFAFDRGSFKYNYFGDWDVRAENDLLAPEGTVSASGTYTQIVLESAGVQAVSVTGLDFDVNFGTVEGLPIINLNEEVNGTVSDALFGPASDPDQAFINLHKGATTNLPAIAFSGADVMVGNGGGDIFIGYGGNDRLRGRGGDDVLGGGSGADRLAGGAGSDRLLGNAGNDIFDFAFASHSPNKGRDIIGDFTQGEDRIDLSTIDADTSIVGNQNFSFIGTAGFSGDAGELRYIQRNSFTLIRGDVNGDGQADFTIAARHVIAFDGSDFI